MINAGSGADSDTTRPGARVCATLRSSAATFIHPQIADIKHVIGKLIRPVIEITGTRR
jgi:hypothetical protein